MILPLKSKTVSDVLRIKSSRMILGWMVLCILLSGTMHAHHFKGLPHYNYFENYPQVPEEEFLGQAGNYEFSLVVYDFQGINREQTESPDKVRLFLLIFSLLENKVYNGPITLEILDNNAPMETVQFESADLENIYSLHRDLPDSGRYKLRMTLHEENDLKCEIPFKLSSQKVHWARWIALFLVLMMSVAAVGARKARVKQDRLESARRNKRQKEVEDEVDATQ